MFNVENCADRSCHLDLVGATLAPCAGLSARVAGIGALFGCVGAPCCGAIPFVSYIGVGMLVSGTTGFLVPGITCSLPRQEQGENDNASVASTAAVAVDLDATGVGLPHVDIPGLEEIPL